AARWIRLNLVLLGLVLIVSLSFPVSSLSEKLNDFYFRLRGPQPPSTRVALVLIDDAALARYGRWPWHRAQLAGWVQAVNEQQPTVVGVDILLSEAEDENNDAALAKAIQSAPNAVLATKISSSQTGSLWIDPLPRFLQAAKGSGHVQAILDFDGICRSIPPQEPSADGLRPAFAFKLVSLLRSAPGTSGAFAPAASGVERLQAAAPFLIDYRPQFEPGQDRPPFVVVSAADLLASKASPELAGKAVLIGFGSTEVSDRLVTPVSDQSPMPGV